jgi:hypothetical protein
LVNNNWRILHINLKNKAKINFFYKDGEFQNVSPRPAPHRALRPHSSSRCVDRNG